MDISAADELSAVKQPERIATSKVERFMDEIREALAAMQESVDMAATNADVAAHQSSRVADSNFYVICLLALFGGGLAIATLISILIVMLVAVTHGVGM